MSNRNATFAGIEQGPIRPPSEAESLLLRVTRNCPWNQCTFCGLYKGETFSVRPVEDVLRDIDSVRSVIDDLQKGEIRDSSAVDRWSYHTAKAWFENGMTSVFLQDANSLIIDPDDLIRILTAVRENFPQVERITSYARSQTIAKISVKDLSRLREAGLNRIHIGMESGSDLILKKIKKGVDKETHIKAGLKVKQAGIELSEYIMPGLGGVEYSEENAIETASALNGIDPDIIRIRTLALPDQTGLAADMRNGLFSRAGDVRIIREMILLLESLDGIHSTIISDHIINLLPEVEGRLPDDKKYMLSVMKNFLALDDVEKMIYIIGRRLGIMRGLHDLNSDSRRRYALDFILQNHVEPSNAEAFAAELMKRYI